MNRVLLIGRLGADVETKEAGGTVIASFRMATGRKYTNANGKEVDGTQWHRCKAFGKTAEVASKFLSKGSEVAVEGRIETSSYEKNGEKRYSTEIVVERLKLIGGKVSRETGAGEPGDTPVRENKYLVGDDCPF